MSPLGIVAIVGAVLSMLAYSRRPTKRFRVNVQFAVALASWGLLWFATGSPFAAQGMMNLPKHMIGHVIVMFVVPMGLVGSSFLRSLWWIVAPPARRRLLRWWYLGRTWRAPRWLFHPLTAMVVLNVVMVASHTPRVFDFAMTHQWSMDWLMEPAFLFSGLFFFHFIVSSPPRREHVRVRYQFVMIFVTIAEMTVLAMAMSIFTDASWYSVMQTHPGMESMPGMARTASQAFSQQRLAAGILWICGDFWASPWIVMIVRRVILRDGSIMAALERQSSRLSGVAG